MNLDPIIALLQARLGLAPESLGPHALRTAIQGRMARLGLGEPAQYAQRLDHDSEEFLALVEEVVVPESWFFRGAELFEFIACQVMERQHTATGPYRLLSAPCGAGQEPYSVAIALTEAGLPTTAWSIDALDISPRHLRQARHGVYGALAFRELSPPLRARYFQEGPDGTRIGASIQNVPRFRQGNLLDPQFFQGEPPFDFILCRNLLIYLHPAARSQVLANLKRLLAPDGMLATGTAENLPALDTDFMPVGSMPGVYRRAMKAVALPLPRTTAPQIMPILAVPKLTQVATSMPPRTPVRAAAPLSLLALARDHADQGRLDAALEDITTHLKQAGPSAAALSLLGILRQALGDEAAAMRSFQKALYLEPDHAEALVHLMLLCEARGDTLQVERLRRRLHRLHLEADA